MVEFWVPKTDCVEHYGRPKTDLKVSTSDFGTGGLSISSPLGITPIASVDS